MQDVLAHVPGAYQLTLNLVAGPEHKTQALTCYTHAMNRVGFILDPIVYSGDEPHIAPGVGTSITFRRLFLGQGRSGDYVLDDDKRKVYVHT